MSGRTLIVGVGSSILCDDGVGGHVVRRLGTTLRRDDVDVIEIGTAGFGLLDLVDGYDRLILVDAMVTGVTPGSVRELDEREVTRTVHLNATGHDADLATTLAAGRALPGLSMPSQVIVLGVEAADVTTFSERLTPEVDAALPEVVSRIEALLADR